jgi:hypothetical protein
MLVATLNFFMLSVVMLSVFAPFKHSGHLDSFESKI